MGFITAGDTPPLQFSLYPGSCPAADNGSQVQPINSAGVALPWCWMASPNGKWLASEFGVSIANNTAQGNTDALNNLWKAAYNSPYKGFIDIVGNIPYNGMTVYGNSSIGSYPSTHLLMQQDGIGLLTLPSPGASPGEVQRLNADTFYVDMQSHHGTAYMWQAVTNSNITNIQWAGVNAGTFTYDDGVASGAYPDAGETVKCISTAGIECWWSQYTNFRSNDGLNKTAGTCSSSTLTLNTAGINDLSGTVYVVDTTTPSALPTGTTVTSHNATSVTLSNACTSVTAGDNISVTTAAVELNITTTVGNTTQVPNSNTFQSGLVKGGAIGINNALGGHNQFIAVDISKNGSGGINGGSGKNIADNVWWITFQENEAVTGLNITSDSSNTNIFRTGGTSGTSVPITDNGANTVYGGNFFIGNSNNIVMEPDTGGDANNALRLRNVTNSSGTKLDIMPNGTADAILRLYNDPDKTGAKQGWIQMDMAGNDGTTVFFGVGSRGSGVTPTTMQFSGLKLLAPALSAAATGTHALCMNTTTHEIVLSGTSTCP